MKVTINLRDYFLDAADRDHMLTATTRFSVDELFDGNAIGQKHAFHIDIHELLAENRTIGHLWSVAEVQDMRPDLDDHQAWQVLQTVMDRLDSRDGISWDTIGVIADELFGPEPERCWCGRIDVTITDTDRDLSRGGAIHLLRDMATRLAREMPDVEANADEGSVRLLGPETTASA
jgi:hypothetical protein